MKPTRLVLAIAGALAPFSALAQPCPTFIPIPRQLDTGVRLGTSITVQLTDMVDWDPDGAGEQPSLVVFCGNFDGAGSVVPTPPATRLGVAAWNGSRFVGLGAGLRNTTGTTFTDVRRLMVFQGQLVAAGNNLSETGANPRPVVRFDGSAWQPMGSAINGVASDLAIIGGELYAVGDFGPGSVARGVVKWNGADWEALTPAIPSPRSDQPAYAIGSFRDTPAIHMGNTALHLSGGQWVELGSVPNWTGYPSSIVEHQGELWMTTPDPRRWNGSLWRFGSFYSRNVSRFQVIGEHLYALNGDSSASGFGYTIPIGAPEPFSMVVTQTVLASVVRTTRGTFEVVASVGPTGQVVRAMLSRPDRVLLAQSALLQSVPSSTNSFPVNSVTTITENLAGSVLTGVEWKGKLVLGGNFNGAGEALSTNILVWDGAQFTSLGLGIDIPRTAVRALATDGEALYAAYGSASSTTSQRGVARLTPTGWVPMGQLAVEPIALAVIGQDVNPYVFAGGLRRWDGSAWTNPPGTPANINSMVFSATEAFAIHPAQTVGGVPNTVLSAFDGVNWTSLESTSVSVDLLALDGDRPVVRAVVSPVPPIIRELRRYAAGGGYSVVPDPPAGVGFLTTYRGRLANPVLNTINGVTSSFAVFDGTAWVAPPGVGVLPTTLVTLLAVAQPFRGEDWFMLARADRNASNPAVPYVTRFSPTGIPWIARQPKPASTGCGASADFEVTPATGYPGVQVRWQRETLAGSGTFVDLSDGPTASGSTISGATAPRLRIVNAGGSDLGLYRAQVFNTCGGSISEPAPLMSTGCPCNLADITGIGGPPALPDGQLTVDDILEFVGLFGASTGCPSLLDKPCSPADVTAIGGGPPDGQLTVDDVIVYVAAFGDGC